MTNFIRSQHYQIVHSHYPDAGILRRIAARRGGPSISVHTYQTFSWKVAHAFHSSAWRNYISSAKERLYVTIERYAASLTQFLMVGEGPLGLLTQEMRNSASHKLVGLHLRGGRQYAICQL